jgi:hypothetical protein
MMIDDKGWLISASGDPVGKRFPTVRTYELATPAPLGIVWHTTDGRGGPGYAEALARRAQTFQRGVDRPASWHVLIAKDGAIYHMPATAYGRLCRVVRYAANLSLAVGPPLGGAAFR